MADYRDLLRRAIEVLPENNGNARRQVYDKARAALRKQLDAIQPELPSREKTHHRLQLEECIREVEQEATERILSGLSQLDHEDYAPRKVDLPESESEAESRSAPPPQTPVEDVVVEAEPEAAEPVVEEPVVEDIATEPDPPVEAEPAPAAEPEPLAEPEPVVAPEAVAEPEPEPETALDDSAESAEPEAEPASEEPEVVAEAEVAETETAPELHLSEPELTEPQAVEKDSPAETDADAGIEDPNREADTSEAEIEPIVSQPVDEAPDVVAAETAIGTAAVEAPKQNPIWSRFKPKPAETAAATSAIETAAALKTEPAMTTEPALEAELAMASEREVEVDADPQNAIDHAIAVLDREASGGAMSDATIETTDPDMADLDFARAEADDEGGGSPALTIFLVLVLLLLAGAGGAGYWAWREGYLDRNLFGSDADVSVSQTAMSTDAASDTPPATDVRQIDSPASDATDTATPEATGPGNTAAMPDVVETPAAGLQQADDQTDGALPGDALALTSPTNTVAATPTMDAGDQPAGNGDTAAATDSLAADAAAAESVDATIAEPAATDDKTDQRLPVAEATSDPATDAANASTAKPEVVADGSQSLLLEASDSANSGAVPFSGRVEWTRGVDELGQPTLEATANIPARNMSVNLLIRKNSDASLPASHLIEIDFNVSDSFIGGGISRIAGILMKNEELVQGVPLVGASARVVGNTFLFALSASNQDVSNNIELLRSRKWMDLAIIYSTGKQAILTLEKDAAAEALFKQVMDVWNPATATETDPAADAAPAETAQ